MPLATCARCKAMFNKVAGPVCPKCEPEENADYEKIRGVLDRVPELNAEEVAKEADISLECVLRMLELGLIKSSGVSKDVKCGQCGAPAISITKRLCQACLQKLNVELSMEQAKIKLPPKKDIQVRGLGTSVRKTMENKRKT